MTLKFKNINGPFICYKTKSRVLRPISNSHSNLSFKGLPTLILIPSMIPFLSRPWTLCPMSLPLGPDLAPPFSPPSLLPYTQAGVQTRHSPSLWFNKQYLGPLPGTGDRTGKLASLSKLLSFLPAPNRTSRSNWNSLPPQASPALWPMVLFSSSELLLFLFSNTHMWSFL